MLRLKQLILTQFKNYDFANFNFKERVIGICGLNGKGKTNLLDAIYYCCFTKSYFSKSDGQNVQFDKDGFRLELDSSISSAGIRKEDNSQEQMVSVTKGNEIICIY